MNSTPRKKTAVIIGAGPAGLTAALELLRRSDVHPVILEADDCVGGISRTINYKGNRIDIGGHRFFSKSDWVMDWWREILPVEATSGEPLTISYQNKARAISGDGGHGERVLMVRRRLSRIYYLRKFFDYPLKLTPATLANLGIVRVMKVGTSYLLARLFPRKPESSLEDFLVNRFGRQLYLTFFRDYTEKVWGVPCQEISAEWGAQRIKGLSISKAVMHAIGKLFRRSGAQKNTHTSLIEQFLYPRLGPGQMWEAVAAQVQARGGELRHRQQVRGLNLENGEIRSVRAHNLASGQDIDIPCDYVISTMPVRDLVRGLGENVPEEVRDIAFNLPYRDFITVGLLVDKMRPNPQSQSVQPNHMPPDNWIYIQESDVKVGRLQIFNNWSPGMVANPDQIWMGLEYFCNEGDALWAMSDADLQQLARNEMARMNLIDPADVRDSIVIRMPKAYPAYFGTYARFDVVRGFLDRIPNLFPIGRNGMHRYNNQDHSMLTARLAVSNIIAGITDKSNIWRVNIDDDYHEEK